MLTLLLLIPIIGILIISTVFSYENSYKTIKRIKLTALITSLLNLFLSLTIFIMFDFTNNNFKYIQEYHQLGPFDIYLSLDSVSIYFLLFTTFIFTIVVYYFGSIRLNVRLWTLLLGLAQTLLFTLFFTLDSSVLYTSCVTVSEFIFNSYACFVCLLTLSTQKITKSSCKKQVYNPLPFRRHITTTITSNTTFYIGLGVYVIWPMLSFLYLYARFVWEGNVLPQCPDAVPADMTNLTELSLYYNYLEICHRSWLLLTDLHTMTNDYDRASYLGLAGGTGTGLEREALRSLMVIVEQAFPDCDVDEISLNYSNRIGEVLERIRLLQPDYIASWSTSLYGESEWEKNTEAFQKYITDYHISQ